MVIILQVHHCREAWNLNLASSPAAFETQSSSLCPKCFWYCSRNFSSSSGPQGKRASGSSAAACLTAYEAKGFVGSGLRVWGLGLCRVRASGLGFGALSGDGADWAVGLSAATESKSRARYCSQEPRPTRSSLKHTFPAQSPRRCLNPKP